MICRRLRILPILVIPAAPLACFSGSDTPPAPNGSVWDGSTIDSSTFDDAPFDVAAVDAAALDATSDSAQADAATPDGAQDDAMADATADASVDATEAGPDAAAGPAVYVDPANGLDTNDGTQAHPFKTIEKAAQNLVNGETIYLLAGTYDTTTQPATSFNFNTVTFVQGMGAVTLKGPGNSSDWFTFTTGGGLHDVAFVASGHGVTAQGGPNRNATFSMSGVTFDTVSYPIFFNGGVVATVDETSAGAFITNVASNAGGFMFSIGDAANVTWKGGTIANSTSNMGVFGLNGATLSVDGLAFNNVLGYAFSAGAGTTLSVKNTTIQSTGIHDLHQWYGAGTIMVFAGAGQATSVSLDSTVITGSPCAAVTVRFGTTAGDSTITLNNSQIDGNAGGGISNDEANGPQTGFAATIRFVVNATNTTFKNNTAATYDSQNGGSFATGAAIRVPHGSITVTGGEISNNADSAVMLRDSASANAITIRGVKLASNAGSTISLAGTNGSTLDLGTASGAGGSTFSGILSGGTAVNLGAPIAGTAIGNSWMPGIQGADSNGQYTTSTTIPAGSSGLNFTTATGSTVVVK
jgi:hypothetical protein